MPDPYLYAVVILLIAALVAVASYGDHPEDDPPTLNTRNDLDE